MDLFTVKIYQDTWEVQGIIWNKEFFQFCLNFFNTALHQLALLIIIFFVLDRK